MYKQENIHNSCFPRYFNTEDTNGFSFIFLLSAYISAIYVLTLIITIFDIPVMS